MGNPHLACVDAELTHEEFAALDVAAPVQLRPRAVPGRVNVEVLTAPAEESVRMRVHERGVGETRSCGTGTVAAAVAALANAGADDRNADRSGARWRRHRHRHRLHQLSCAGHRCWWPTARSPSLVERRSNQMHIRQLRVPPSVTSLMTHAGPSATEQSPSAGELALDDRAALRRVAGLSTELADVSEVEYRQLRLERVVLVGVWTEGSAADAEASMAELAALAETAGSEVLEGADPAPRPARPVDLHRLGQGGRTARRGRWRPAPTPSSATANCPPPS